MKKKIKALYLRIDIYSLFLSLFFSSISLTSTAYLCNYNILSLFSLMLFFTFVDTTYYTAKFCCNNYGECDKQECLKLVFYIVIPALIICFINSIFNLYLNFYQVMCIYCIILNTVLLFSFFQKIKI